MILGTLALDAIDLIARETMWFAAAGILVGGLDDLAIDILYLLRLLFVRRATTIDEAELPPPPPPGEPGRIAILIPAWDEKSVIGAMLGHALRVIDHDDYRIYVGCYPNDPGTIAAVARVAFDDPRVHLVIGAAPGPTTKADCLNALWQALARDAADEGQRVRAVVLHDAEDVVHPLELKIFDALIGRYAAVQLPVLPLFNPMSPYIGSHYCDEFAESHGKQLVVRQALGAGLPLAGVGCAIAYPMLARIARERGGCPFDADSLTEDYEIGLRIAAMGGRAVLARVRLRSGAPMPAVRAYFPATIGAAVRQKARWMTGIAFAGWDRIGWGQWHHLGEHWMRMRDRRAPLAVIVLAASYLALVSWAVSIAAHALAGGGNDALAPIPRWLLMAGGVLLLWRLAMRAAFTGGAYGWVQGVQSMPRMLVGNMIAMLAARRALMQYFGMLRGQGLRWDKTAHIFPDLEAGDARAGRQG